MKKVNVTILAIIGVVILIGLLVIGMSLSQTPGVLLSCETGEFVKFVNIGTPYKIVTLPGYCSGKIKVTSSKGEKVCEIDDYNSEEDTVVRIHCPNLKDHKKENLTIEFWTYSEEYGDNHETIKATY